MTRSAIPLKAPDQVEASIERFRCRFWKRGSGGRPPVGVVPPGAWLPIGYLRKPFSRSHVTPADVVHGLIRYGEVVWMHQ